VTCSRMDLYDVDLGTSGMMMVEAGLGVVRRVRERAVMGE